MSKLSSTALFLGALVRTDLRNRIAGDPEQATKFEAIDFAVGDGIANMETLREHKCIISLGAHRTEDGPSELFRVTRRGYELARKVYDRMSKNPLTAAEELMLYAVLM